MTVVDYDFTATDIWQDFAAEDIIKRVLKELPEAQGELSILLTDDTQIQELNKQYRGKDKPTNVLSFPINENGLLGDIALAYETLQREATEQDKTFENHFTHLFLHGILHLLGYDHEEENEQKHMEEKEVEILHSLGIENPYE